MSNWEDGSFDLDSDFYDLDGGVYLSLYTETGELLYGRIPYGFDLKPDFSDGQLQTLSDSGRQWYVFDLAHRISGYGLVYIRGISSVTEAESSFRITLRFAMIVLPLLVVLTAVIGYLFTRGRSALSAGSRIRYRKFRQTRIFPDASSLEMEPMKFISLPIHLTSCLTGLNVPSGGNSSLLLMFPMSFVLRLP